jgi:hypothetical protein
MRVILILLLAGNWVLGVIFPRIGSILACIPWVLFWLVQTAEASSLRALFTQSGTSSEVDSMFDDAEKKMLPKYGFFFKSPFASTGISDAGSLWAFCTLPWTILLIWGNFWPFLVCPAFVLVAVLHLGPKMNPLLFLGEKAKRNPSLLPTPTKNADEFCVFARLCSKMFPAGHPIRQYVENTQSMIWPNNLASPTRSTRQKEPETRLEADCPVPTEEELLKINIKGLSEMLLECLRERAGLILNAVNRKAVDSTAAARASRELLRLSNKVRSVLNNAIGNFDTDESSQEIKAARTAEELADLAYMRFFTAAVVLKIHSKDDLADEIDRQIEEITGEKKTKLG